MGVHMLKREGAVFQTREEAEEADHARYNEKQARIAERRRLNFEKKLAEGFKCHIEENCAETFPSQAELAEHIKAHKEELKKRLICPYDTSRKTICGKKFRSRREFNEHSEEHVIAFKAKTISGIRSVLLYNKMGLLLDVFEKEYKAMMGKNVPFKALGFPSTYEFLLSVPEAVEVQQLPEGNFLLVAVPNEKTEHMARMVGCQRYKQEGFDYLTGQVLAHQSRDVKRKAEKVTSKRSREVPPFLRQQIVDMMELEENRAGLDSLAFHHTYKEIYDYPLEFLSYGFVNLYDMLHHGMGNSLFLALDQYGGLRIAPASAAPIAGEGFKEKVKQVLSSRRLGLEVSALPFVLTTLGEHLDHLSLGFSDLEELCLSMPDICAFTPPSKPDGEARIMPISAASGIISSTLAGNLEKRSPGQLPSSLLTALRRVLSVADEKGLAVEELLNQYFKVTGTCLRLSDYGLTLKDLVAELSSSSLVYLREGRIFLRNKYFPFSSPIIEQAASASHGWIEVLLVEDNISWVRKEAWLDHLGSLEEALEKRYSKRGTSLPPEEIVVDRFVVCLHPQLGVWVRGQVVSVRELEVDLWMVDYAGLVRLPFNSLRRLLPDFCHLPAFVERLKPSAHEKSIMEPNQQGRWLRVGARSLKEHTCDVLSTENVINLQLRDFLLSSIIKESNCEDSELDFTSCGLTRDRVQAEAENSEETTMEACDLFSETMELHSEDVEYFYIESKRVTERRKRERDNLRREISILKEEKEELREENQQLRRTNKQLKERLSVEEGKISGDLDRDSNINTFTERPFPGAMVKGNSYPTGSEEAAFPSTVAEEELEFKDNVKFRSTLKYTEVFDPTVEEDSRLPKDTTELGSGEEKMEAEFREGKPNDVTPSLPYNPQNEEKPVEEQMQKVVFGAPTIISSKPAPSSYLEATHVEEPKVKKRRRSRTHERSNVFQEATKAAPVRRSSRRLSTLASTIEESPNLLVGAGRDGTNNKKRKALKEVGDVENKDAEGIDFGEILEAYQGEITELESTGSEDPYVNGDSVGPHRTETLQEDEAEKENRGTFGVLGSNSMTPTRKPTIVGEMMPKSSGKKKVRCKFGEDCLGCPLPDCRECSHCLDMTRYGGQNTLRQRCVKRKCRLDSSAKAAVIPESETSTLRSGAC